MLARRSLCSAWVVACGACTSLLPGSDTLPALRDGGDGDAFADGATGALASPGPDGGDARANGAGDASANDADHAGDASANDADHAGDASANDADHAGDSDSDAGGNDAISPDTGSADGGPASVTDLTAWNTHVCARLGSGHVWCWGAGLGVGVDGPATAPQELPSAAGGSLDGVAQIAVGFEHMCARTPYGRVFCWGDQSWGETGIAQSFALQPLADPTRIVVGIYTSITAGGWNGASNEPWGGHTCGIDTQGHVWCWGTNDDDALGQAPDDAGACVVQAQGSSRVSLCDPTPRSIAGLTGVTQIALHDGGGCALSMDGTVSCWGWNGENQLANGSLADSPAPVLVQIAPGQPLQNVRKVYGGHDDVCALQVSGTLYCWGRNDDGVLGLGEGKGTQWSGPVVYAGGQVGRIADAAIGQRHLCVVRASDGSVWCSGYNAEFELGQGNSGSDPDAGCLSCIASPAQVVGPGGQGFLTGVLELAATWASTCARTGAGVYCWGDNDLGQTGHLPSAGDDHTNGHVSTQSPTLVEGLPQ